MIVADRLFECHGCGLVCRIDSLPAGSKATCVRCGSTILRHPAGSLDRTLALALTGLVLMGIAMTMPFMSMTLQGRVQEASLLTGAVALFEQGLWTLCVVVLLTTVVAPTIRLGALVYVIAGARLSRPPRDLPVAARWVGRMNEWAMIEVYLLGVFVAYVKLIDLARIELGVAFWSLAGLMLLMVMVNGAFSPELMWQALERRGLVGRPVPPPAEGGGPPLSCHTCGLAAAPAGGRCQRCAAPLHERHPNSIARAWALTLTAMILYVPANAYPVMTVISFGSGAPDTILSGIEELFAAGMWPLALLVFFASISVPVLKLVGLMLLLVATQRGSRRRLRDRTLLYRIVEAIGRWSMIDIFMISILVGIVRLGSIATIDTGIGAVAFAGVVIVTMFAATSYDPRLMWDAAGANDGPR